MGSSVKKRGRLFYGWWVVIAAASIQFYGSGIWFYGFSVIFNAILGEFGWTRAVTAGAFSLSRLEGGLEGPIVGWCIDKFGPRKMALFGAVVVGFGYLLLSGMNALWQLYVLFGVVIALGYSAGFSRAATAAVANWFIRKRGRALGFYTLGAGLGGATIVPLIGWLISQYGWRTTVVIAGIGVWVIVIPLTLVLRHKPEQYGYLPDGDVLVVKQTQIDIESSGVSVPGKNIGDYSGEVNFTWREALHTSTFWILLLAGSARSIGMTSVVLHEVAYLTDIGISEVAAAAALGSMVAFSIPGRIIFGWLGDRFDKRYVLMVSYVLQAIGIFVLTNVATIGQVYIFLAIYGIGYGGGIPVYVAMRGEYFGRKAFATIAGIFQTFLVIPTVVGPIFAGYIYDVTGSYNQAFLLFMLLYLVGAGIIPFIKRPKPRRTPLV
ncbi:MAG: MFS transporter [Dehalococcoidales bacterium]|nr:MFS transporter [Dehalococcoidales bacterium]